VVSALLVIAMIAIVHAIEAYFLNPRIVSSYIKIPVFVTFLILLVSEHFLGLAGLLIGVPVFVISVGLLGDIDQYISEIKQQVHAPKI
jgi:predicted PurR-regulated permease PerM